MFTVHDLKHTGMPVLATVTSAEAGYEFAERNGFRESACVLPREAPECPDADSYLRHNKAMTNVRETHPREEFPGAHTVRARIRAFTNDYDEEREAAAVAFVAEKIGAGTSYPSTHTNTVAETA